MGGKSSTPQIVQPSPPPAPPTYSQTLQDYVKSIPDLLSAEQKYGPGFAQNELDLVKQFGTPISQAYQSIDQALYPNTSKLQEQVAGQALEGLGSQLPDQLAQQYASDFNAGIGANANAPIGVSSRNIGLYSLQEDWRRYYRDLALTTAGRQPLRQGAAPQGGAATAGFGNALNYQAQTYGTYAPSVANQNMLAIPRGGGSGGIGGAGRGASMGALAGLALAIPTGGLSIPAGLALGGGLGALGGGFGAF